MSIVTFGEFWTELFIHESMYLSNLFAIGRMWYKLNF